MKVSPRLSAGRLGVAGKFVLAIVASLVVLSAAIAMVALSLERNALGDLLDTSRAVVESMTDEQIRDNEAAAKQKADQLVRMLAQMAPGPIAELDLSLLLSISQIAAEDPDISLVEFRNTSNLVMAKAGNAEGIHETLKQDVVSDGVKLGDVTVAYNLRRVHESAAQVREQFAANLASMQTARTKALAKSAISILVMLVGFGVVFAFGMAFLVSRIIKKPLAKVVDAAHVLANGDLTASVAYQSGDEVGQLADAFNDMAANFRRIIDEVNSATAQLAVASEQMATITEQTDHGIQRQKGDTDQVATAMTEMHATVQDVADSTLQAAEAARKSKEEADRGQQVVSSTMNTIEGLARDVEKTANVIGELRTDSENIGVILDVIREVAEQTNLLALNAAIEAARAGEHGRGFAVVADEVRTLAQRTQKSTAEIQKVIEKLQVRAQHAFKAMEEGRQQTMASVEQADKALGSLRMISDAVTRITDMNAHIASAAEQQTTVVDEMNRNMVNISSVAEQNAASMAQLETASATLAELANRLQTLVHRFKT